ncbi:hypothetical protein F6R98_05225 [Candidatus Methylospira mobilis]|uniref:Uncharacterized protein n=1 Tax=Candidatus Methylospira mobilis TaxID=1808979 RepID=A0A5Q0BG49_9GAMM|nr:hypothetical protein [Candidatus Methylospira mobilis]QFY42102.1 hypothetical protein F6R98_05225 [Candidatus Methylospira mobilis]WNV03112.1 hypothetical protein RP726_11595 [Candidatus Methylospira mobilis]
MIEPVSIDFLLQAVISAALIVLFGAGYAAAYAWFRLNGQRTLQLLLACCCYLLLAAAALNLAAACHLVGAWRVLVGLMLFGYLFAPHFIWRLYIRTHPSAPGHVRAIGIFR